MFALAQDQPFCRCLDNDADYVKPLDMLAEMCAIETLTPTPHFE